MRCCCWRACRLFIGHQGPERSRGQSGVLTVVTELAVVKTRKLVKWASSLAEQDFQRLVTYALKLDVADRFVGKVRQLRGRIGNLYRE